MKYVVQGISFPDPELLANAKAKAVQLGLSFSNYVCRLVARDLATNLVKLDATGMPEMEAYEGDSRKSSSRVPIQYTGDGISIGGLVLNDAEAAAVAEAAGMTLAQLRSLSQASAAELLIQLGHGGRARKPRRAVKPRPPAVV